MKQPNKKESGLAHLGLIVAAILVVAALAFAGWWVWEKNQDKDTNSSSQSSQNETQKEESNETNDPSEGGKYLVIAEWDVRFPLPEELRGDVKYGVFSSGSGEQSANFALAEIDQLPESNCDLEERTYNGGAGILGGIASIHRKSTQYPTEIAQRYASESRLGDYWYYVESMRDACFTASNADFARLVGDIEELANAMKDLQLIK